MIERELMWNPPTGHNVDEVEADLAEAILRVAETLVPRRTRKGPRMGWGGDTQTRATVEVNWAARVEVLKRSKTGLPQ